MLKSGEEFLQKSAKALKSNFKKQEFTIILLFFCKCENAQVGAKYYRDSVIFLYRNKKKLTIRKTETKIIETMISIAANMKVTTCAMIFFRYVIILSFSSFYTSIIRSCVVPVE